MKEKMTEKQLILKELKEDLLQRQKNLRHAENVFDRTSTVIKNSKVIVEPITDDRETSEPVTSKQVIFSLNKNDRAFIAIEGVPFYEKQLNDFWVKAKEKFSSVSKKP